MTINSKQLSSKAEKGSLMNRTALSAWRNDQLKTNHIYISGHSLIHIGFSLKIVLKPSYVAWPNRWHSSIIKT